MLGNDNAVLEKKQALGKSREEEKETNFCSKGCDAASGRQPKTHENLYVATQVGEIRFSNYCKRWYLISKEVPKLSKSFSLLVS